MYEELRIIPKRHFRRYEGYRNIRGRHEFIKDDKTVSAVIRKFEIIGEATKGIPDEVRQKYPDVPCGRWQE